jgi:hypothetical protein
MRSSRTTLLAIAAVALAVAGCGGSDVAADEVPGNPPALTVPSDNELDAGASDAESTTDESTEPDAAAEDATGAAESVAPAEPADPSGGTVAPDDSQAAAPEDTTADPAQPPADSPPEQFESFCEQNAGAC